MLALSNKNAILLTTQQAYVAYGGHYSICCVACNISLQIIIIITTIIIILLLSLLVLLLHFHSNIRSLKTWWSTSFKASHSATFLTHNTRFCQIESNTKQHISCLIKYHRYCSVLSHNKFSFTPQTFRIPLSFLSTFSQFLPI